jgi:MinD-like ATPase involved in chromosome partitioning or flagellar assembly
MFFIDFSCKTDIPVMMSKPDSEIGQAYQHITQQLLQAMDATAGKKGPAISMD